MLTRMSFEDIHRVVVQWSYGDYTDTYTRGVIVGLFFFPI
jgi:hypothetical protein